jgi:hypothetical protein
MSLPVYYFAERRWAALYAARVQTRAVVAVVQGGKWGVSDPHFADPFFAPRRVRRGSLTPHLHASFVQSNCMHPVSFVERAAACSSRTVRINAPVRFRRDPAFIR